MDLIFTVLLDLRGRPENGHSCGVTFFCVAFVDLVQKRVKIGKVRTERLDSWVSKAARLREDTT